MAYELIYSALSPLTDNGIDELGKYSDKEGYMISTLSASSENIILYDFTHQMDIIKDAEFTILQMHIETNTITSLTDFIPPNNVHYEPINFQITDTSIIANVLSVGTLVDYIRKSKNRYLFLPIHYGCETYNYGHRAVMVIDKKEKHVYLLDPNGIPSYFNTVLELQLENSIEFFLDYYIRQLNDVFSMDYKYIHTNIWNPSKIVLNNTSNVQMSRGDCLTISLMICQLINNLEMAPGNIYELVKMLTDSEFVSIIRSYSLGILKYLRYSKNRNDLMYTERLYAMYLEIKNSVNLKSVYELGNFLTETKKNNPEFYDDLTKIYKLIAV